MIGGFPCKFLSRARGKSKENLKNTHSIFFWELTRILELVTKAANNDIMVQDIVENVIMDPEPEDIVSEKLDSRSTKIPASPACAAGRDRLLWIDFNFNTLPGETTEQKRPSQHTTLLRKPREAQLLE